MLKVLLQIYAKEGVEGMYKGFGATMLNTFSQREYLYFTFGFLLSNWLYLQNMPISSSIPSYDQPTRSVSRANSPLDRLCLHSQQQQNYCSGLLLVVSLKSSPFPCPLLLLGNKSDDQRSSGMISLPKPWLIARVTTPSLELPGKSSKKKASLVSGSVSSQEWFSP